MININNSIKCINFSNSLFAKRLSFKANNPDTFTKSNNYENEKTAEKKEITINPQQNKLIKRKLIKMDNTKVYKQRNKDFDTNTVCEKLKARIIAFPFVIKGVMALIPTYLNQKIDADNFTQVYLERTPHLFTRLDYGQDKEAFAKDFEPEIKMIKNVNIACDDYQNNNTEQSSLDANIEENLEEYLKTPENKDIFYLE